MTIAAYLNARGGTAKQAIAELRAESAMKRCESYFQKSGTL